MSDELPNAMSNKRMINSTSVGLVFVGGSGQFEITNDEKTYIMAQVEQGLEELANNEPNANMSWTFSALSVNINNITPWEGADWKGLPDNFYKGIDAAVYNNKNDRIYFFKGSQFVRLAHNTVDAGPNLIRDNWRGLTAEFNSGIDAAVYNNKNDRIYFFKGSQFVRINPDNFTADSDVKPIAGNWKELPASFNSGIDAAVYNGVNDRIYFFKGSQFVRINPDNFTADSDVKPIAGNWKELPASFNSGIDAAVNNDVTNLIYLFKGRTYVRINPETFTRVVHRFIDDSWMPFPRN